MTRVAAALGVVLFVLSTGKCEITSSSELNCDFSSECSWRNGTNGVDDNADFSQLDSFSNGKYEISHLSAEGGDFLVASSLGGYQDSMLISDVISCQLGGSQIKYWYWRTGKESTLKVCIRQPPGNHDPSFLRCYDGTTAIYAQQWTYHTVELPPVSQPFEIVLRTEIVAPFEAIAIDEIAFDAILCESTNSGATEGAGGAFESSAASNDFDRVQIPQLHGETISPNTHPILSTGVDSTHFGGHYHREAGPTTGLLYAKDSLSSRNDISRDGPPLNGFGRVGPQFQSRCPQIDCNFESNNLCNYVTSTTDTDLLLNVPSRGEQKPFAISADRVANSLTGIPHGVSSRFFAYAGNSSNPSDLYVLSTTTPVRIAAPSARLDFYIYHAGVNGRFRVCIDSLSNCPFELLGKNLDANAKQWRNYYVIVPGGSHAIHFVVDRLKKNYVIGLDSIQLLNRYGMASAACL